MISNGDQITVRVLKYDGTEYRRWNASLARRDGLLIVLDAQFEAAVEHAELGTIPCGTKTTEYYWLGRWYNVFQFMNKDGGTRLYYCNINAPPELKDNELIYVDLDIDILVQADWSFQVLDLEEFEVNARRYGYSDEVKQSALRALEDLTSMIAKRTFPFTGASAIEPVFLS